MTKNYLKFKSRIRIVSTLVMCVWLVFIYKLFTIQIIDRVDNPQGMKVEMIKGKRGNIFDASGSNITQNLTFYNIGVHPKKIANKEIFLRDLSNCTGTDLGIYNSKFNIAKSYIQLEKKTIKNCEELKSSYGSAIVINQDYKRYYPEENLFGQIVGFTNVDDIGIVGLESQYNKYLEPKTGSRVFKRNGFGKRIADPTLAYEAPENGSDIFLTMNKEYQAILREELIDQVEKTEASSAMGIILNPQTGEIVSMVSVPDFNPNNPKDFETELQKNRLLLDTIEPGSTFKPFFWAWATENGKATPDEVLPTPGGGPMTSGIRFKDGRRSRRIKDAWGYEKSTWSNALVKSLNTAMAMIAQRTTATEMQNMIEAFGFKSDSGISMPGEAASITTSPKKWDMLYTHLTVSFGQEIAITPIQLARAFCVFARDDGRLPLLRLTRSARSDTYTTPAFPVLSKDTVITSRTFLREVMTDGTGRKAQSEKYTIFGKSGTPQMPNVMKQKGAGGYYDDRYNPNFLGAAPMNTPRIVVACGLQDPLKGSGANTDHNNHGYGGGYSAGRVVRDMIDFSLQYMGVKEDLPARDFALGE